MKETSPDASSIDRLRSWAQSKVHGGNRSTARRPGTDHLPDPNLLPISNNRTTSTLITTGTTSSSNNGTTLISSSRDAVGAGGDGKNSDAAASGINILHQNAEPPNGPEGGSQSTPSPQASRKGSQLGTEAHAETIINEKTGEEEDQDKPPKPTRFKRFFISARKIITYSWLNVLLVFVPVGIAVELVGMSPGIIFGMNAIAIIPLAGLLSLATESVAHRMGDAVGALMNITFGNAVELIIFIALVKNEIRIVQASILGSILSNLLLILGMSFLLGGLRYREQIYNSTVTQMSACLLSLSVISLVLPTAFHASFRDEATADAKALIVSRGTSIILLLVYGIYLLFQLKSHSYMYESTPQAVIDEECTPGPAVAWFDSSSSDSSSSSSDSDTSGHSRDTIQKRMKRMVRRRRKSSFASMDTVDTAGTLQTRPSPGTETTGPVLDNASPFGDQSGRVLPLLPRTGTMDSSVITEDNDTSDDDRDRRRRRRHRKKRSKRDRKHRKKQHSHGTNSPTTEQTLAEIPEAAEKPAGEPRRVDFALNNHADAASANTTTTTTTTLGSSSEAGPAHRRALLALLPIAQNLTPTVFAQPPTQADAVPTGPVPRVRYGIRRTNSLPGRLTEQNIRAPGALFPAQISSHAMNIATGAESKHPDGAPLQDEISRVSAVVMLLISTGFVAVCAEFMVGSIDGLVATSSISEVFVGLIVLPIVGNAAEHVTAITVAMKNKMDLAIGVAVGSSIQVALFMTPLTVMIGWALGVDMTLYFTLFQTVCLFVSAFIVNFLVLDGRSNYLEGVLLCATYVVIALVAFFYPNEADVSQWG